METLSDLPKVHGRHRDRPLAAERRARAIELHRRGLTYQQVADEMGYANRGTVHRIIKTALEDRVADSVDELRMAEVDRLDALQAALWTRAVRGDGRAVEAVLRIIDARCKVLSLYGLQGPESFNVPRRFLW